MSDAVSPPSSKPLPVRLTLPDAPVLQAMLRLANDLHAMADDWRAMAALRGIATLAQADLAAAWSGPATRLTAMGIARREPGDQWAAVEPIPPQDAMLPPGAGLLIGRRPGLSPVVRLQTTASGAHEIRSVCAGDRGPSLLVLRCVGRPFDAAQRTIVHLLHPQCEWALHPRNTSAATAEARALSPRHEVVLHLLLGGETERQMADRLQKSAHTVHSRIKHIYRHFNVASRAQLLAKFVVSPQQK